MRSPFVTITWTIQWWLTWPVGIRIRSIALLKPNAHQRQPDSASRMVDGTINREVDSIMNASPSPLVDSLLLRYNE